MLLFIHGRCIMIPKFDGKEIWSKFLDSTANLEERPTVFMGVPTMYSKLLESYETLYGSNLQMVEYVRAICSSNFRYISEFSYRTCFYLVTVDSILFQIIQSYDKRVCSATRTSLSSMDKRHRASDCGTLRHGLLFNP